MIKIKDSYGLFYKHISQWILSDSKFMAEMRGEFCFKSQLVRSLKMPNLIMEVFKPT